MAIQTKTVKCQKDRHSSYLPIAVIIFIILAVIAVGVSLLIIKPWEPTEPAQIDKTNHDIGKSSDDAKPLGEEKTKENEPTRETEKGNLKYDDSGLSETSDLVGIVNFAGISEGKLLVNITISEYLSSGTCSFTLTSPSGKTLSGSDSISAGPDAGFCSFSTPASGIEPGKWQISVKMENGNKSGIVNTEATF